jgi:hypothetical protein
LIVDKGSVEREVENSVEKWGTSRVVVHQIYRRSLRANRRGEDLCPILIALKLNAVVLLKQIVPPPVVSPFEEQGPVAFATPMMGSSRTTPSAKAYGTNKKFEKQASADSSNVRRAFDMSGLNECSWQSQCQNYSCNESPGISRLAFLALGIEAILCILLAYFWPLAEQLANGTTREWASNKLSVPEDRGA